MKLARLLALLFLLLPTVFALPRLGTEMHAFWNDSYWLSANPSLERVGTIFLLPDSYEYGLDRLSLYAGPQIGAASVRDMLAGLPENSGFSQCALL